MITDLELISKATQITNPRSISNSVEVGSVGCALVTDKNNVYVGICIDAKCSIGFCAEHNAIGNMLTNGESKIIRIVTVNKHDKILSPCGRCREFIYQIDHYNKNTQVILADNVIKTIEELLPDHWKV